MGENNWDITANRFVAFFDIMGFKDLVARSRHEDVVKKLNLLKNTLKDLETIDHTLIDSLQIEKLQTRSVTFSDSIIFFSKGDTIQDACKIVIDSHTILSEAIENGIGIKGA